MLRQRVDPELLNRVVKRRVAEVRGEARRLTDPRFASAAAAVAEEAERRSEQFVTDALAMWFLRVRDAQEAEERRYEVVQKYLRWQDYMDGAVEGIRYYASLAE